MRRTCHSKMILFKLSFADRLIHDKCCDESLFPPMNHETPGSGKPTLLMHARVHTLAVLQDDAPLSTPCQRSASPSRNAEAASASQLPTPQRSSHRMATRRQSGIVPARRKYYDDEEDASLELSPAICPVDTFGPPTPFPANGGHPSNFSVVMHHAASCMLVCLCANFFAPSPGQLLGDSVLCNLRAHTPLRESRTEVDLP
jgi:hypothetical protein